MRYALLDGETVINLAVIYEGNADEFANAVPAGDVPVQPGDSYMDGAFYRGGAMLLSPLAQASETIAALDAEVVELTYRNILLEYGM